MPAEYMRSNRVDASRVGERVVLYHRDNREALVLNASGSWLWQLLDTARTREDLARSLQRQYGVSPTQAVVDVDQFLGDLRLHDAVVGS